jgi:quinol monooxygenase YgiN
MLSPALLTGVAGLLALPLVALAADQAEPNPLVIRIKPELKDPSKPFTWIVCLQAKDGMQAKLEAAFAKVAKEPHREKGCLAYDVNRDVKEPRRYLIYERWKSLADMEAHLTSPYITTLQAELSRRLEETLAIRKVKLGLNHPDMMRSMFPLAG